MNEVNLRCINTLKKYGSAVGYSGHEQGINTTIASVCLGAEVIERHITLDKTMWGTDQSSSLEPEELKKLVLGIREVEQALGDGKIGVTKSEEIVREKLRI
jgi:N-acetylneuraminate synthase